MGVSESALSSVRFRNLLQCFRVDLLELSGQVACLVMPPKGTARELPDLVGKLLKASSSASVADLVPMVPQVIAFRIATLAIKRAARRATFFARRADRDRSGLGV